jgi:radical SAM superfamily enzyme YgiQ (UPF0313 family)
MKNVSLVFPRFKYPSGDIPYGIASLASYIRRELNVKISIIDATFNPKMSYIESSLKQNKADIVGIYVNTIAFYDALKVAKIAKKLGSFVVVGGPHATILPETLINKEFIDAVVIGEGEITLKEIIQRIQSNKDLNGLKGIWHKDDNKIIKEDARPPIANLDNLPFPAWDLLDMRNYIKNWFQLDFVNPNLRGVNISGSRGCPFDCAFCQPTLRKIFGTKVRLRSPENVVEEIKTLKKLYKINAFWFLDDTLTGFRWWVENFCNILKDEKINLIWGCTTRANLIDEKLMKMMRNVGLRKISIGGESASQRVLDEIYNKGIKIEDVEKTARLAKKLGIIVQVFFMMGAPTETLREINKTIKFASSIPSEEATFSITTPLPCTHLYEYVKEHDFKLSENYEDFDYYSKKALLSNSLSSEKLKYLQKKAFIYFYLHPKRFTYLFKSLSSFKGINKLRLKLKRII